jgi:hypothetical protein
LSKRKPFDPETARRDKEIARRINHVITERKLPKSEVAAGAGISESTLYAHLAGWPPIPVSRVGDIIRGAPEVGIEIAETVIDAERNELLVMRRPVVGAAGGDVLEAAVRVGEASGQLQGATLEAVSDGVLTDVESSVLERAADELERRAEHLRALARSSTLRVVKTEGASRR